MGPVVVILCLAVVTLIIYIVVTDTKPNRELEAENARLRRILSNVERLALNNSDVYPEMSRMVIHEIQPPQKEELT